MGDQNQNKTDEAVAAAVKKAEDDSKAHAKAAAAKNAATEAAESVWLHDPDYTGPLTAEQAQRRLEKHGHWRPEHSKTHETKPAEGGQVKATK